MGFDQVQEPPPPMTLGTSAMKVRQCALAVTAKFGLGHRSSPSEMARGEAAEPSKMALGGGAELMMSMRSKFDFWRSIRVDPM
jgi:hypothetical protein